MRVSEIGSRARLFAAVTACLFALPAWSLPKYAVERITPRVTVIRGPVNGVLIRQANKTLAIYGDPRPNPPAAQRVLFTHYRRDAAWAGRELARHGAVAVAPLASKPFFTDVRAFWERFQTARFHDYSQQTSKVLTEPVNIAETVRGGDHLDWEGIPIQVIDTPGYARGAVSYLFKADGKRIACVGDLIYGDGRILDLYSLQDAIPETKEDGYHGWAARAADLIASLRAVAAAKPDLLIPSRGPVIRDPGQAIGKLTERLRAVFASHFAIDALRWYRGDEKIRLQAARVLGTTPLDWMAAAETVQEKLPGWIVPIGNSRLLLSQSGAAFLIDGGNRKIQAQLEEMRRQGRFRNLEGLYVTHYHDDHTNQAQAIADQFQCPVFACEELRDILERPGAYRMPAVTTSAIRKLTVMPEGAARRWHEFEFRSFFYPGQTLYHGALLVARDGGESVFFIGDSFTPTGIDDYCLLNRNFLEPERGFLYCLDLLRKTAPQALLINQHVAPAFRFSAAQTGQMTANLRARRELLRELFPWDDPNFGMDEQWARFYPYGTETAAGAAVELKLIVRNHSLSRRIYSVVPHAPAGWSVPRGPLVLRIGAREEGSVTISLTPPAAGGFAVVTADIASGSWEWREWAEALVVSRGPAATLPPAPAPRPGRAGR